MEDVEIYLNRFASEKQLYAELAEKLGSDAVTDKNELAGALMNVDSESKFRLYVSNEDIPNETIDEITEVFRECEKNSKFVKMEIIEDEFLNLIDDTAHLTDTSKPRSLVHRDGDLHPAVHVWIIRRRDQGIFVLLQKRSHEKKISPDCYDVSAAGHLSQGDEFRKAAVRETAEELGLKIHGSELEHIGLLESHYSEGDINDNELRSIYLYRGTVHIEDLVLQSSEVSDVCWAEIDEMLAVIDEDGFDNCIDLRELALIKKAVF
jgi:isopentenyldiphosphate isomerase